MPVAGLYIATAAGALALFFMMPRRGASLTAFGALIGVMTVAGLWLGLARYLPEKLGFDDTAFIYYYVFSGISIVAAVRVITNRRPVYSALWFVMVVLASAGLLLALSAEFVAFALIIIYGGAILVTYMFVLMLASHSGDPEDPEDETEHDTVAREPLAAILAGFILLAMVLTVAFDPQIVPPSADTAAAETKRIEALLANRPAARLGEKLGEEAAATLAPSTLDNVERVGVDLFESHPLGLELAGVILLVSLVGAVVIARQRAFVDEQEEAHAA